MKIKINLFLILMTLYLLIDVLFWNRNIFKYLEIKKISEEREIELVCAKDKTEEMERNLNLLYARDSEFVEEILKSKFSLKLKKEYVIYFK